MPSSFEFENKSQVSISGNPNVNSFVVVKPVDEVTVTDTSQSLFSPQESFESYVTGINNSNFESFISSET